MFDTPLPEPQRKVRENSSIYMMGIGGTGVVTVNQILGTAAVLSGKAVASLDQTGLSQKGGPVVSHLKILDSPQEVATKISAGEADCYLVFDLLTGADPKNLSRASADKTIAVISSSRVPTGSMVRSTDVQFPNVDRLVESIEAQTRSDSSIHVDALGLADALFGDHMAANMIVVGAAYQAGALPIPAEAIEQAIALNGTSVTMNQQAFRVGRRLVIDPQWVHSIQPQRAGALDIQPEVTPEARALIDRVNAGGELLRLLEIRVPELIAYQNAAYARQYVEFVKLAADAEQAAASGKTDLSEAVARYLFKLMAYKDEYEVARLHLKNEFRQAVAGQFGDGAKVDYLLHPPFLRALGLKKKIKLGRWFDYAYRLLAAMRGLRGTPLDVFGYARVRRVERELIGEYRRLVEAALETLSAENYARAVKLAALPDLIRGYEEVKLRSVARFRDEVRKLGFGEPEARPGVAMTTGAEAG